MVLTAEQRRQFFEDGFFVVENLFSAAEVAKALECFERLQERAATVQNPTLVDGAWFVVHGTRLDRVVWCGGAEPYLLEIGGDPRLVKPSAELLGSAEMDQIINQAHFKVPGDGVKYDWHQDSEKRRYGTAEWTDVNGKGSYVQTILALDDSGADNGPLYVWPDTVKWGHVGLNKPGATTPKIDESKMLPALLSPGSVLFLHPFAVHGSRANTGNRPRRILINGYAYPGANHRKYPAAPNGRPLKA